MRISHKNIKCHSNSEGVVNRVKAHGKKGQSIWKGKWECMEKLGTIEKYLKPEISINVENVTCGKNNKYEVKSNVRSGIGKSG